MGWIGQRTYEWAKVGPPNHLQTYTYLKYLEIAQIIKDLRIKSKGNLPNPTSKSQIGNHSVRASHLTICEGPECGKKICGTHRAEVFLCVNCHQNLLTVEESTSPQRKIPTRAHPGNPGRCNECPKYSRNQYCYTCQVPMCKDHNYGGYCKNHKSN